MRVGGVEVPAAAQGGPDRSQYRGKRVVDGGYEEIVVAPKLGHARAEREADIEDDVECEEGHASGA